MNNLKPRLQNIMERHYGRQQSITRRELRQVMDMELHQDRKLRMVISELRRDGFPILFATEKPAGYYLPSNLAELKEGIRAMRSYVINEALDKILLALQSPANNNSSVSDYCKQVVERHAFRHDKRKYRHKY